MEKSVKSTNKNLNAARVQKRDEFYTQYSDIENELKYYKKYFKNKVVYCNCDDPSKSNFVKFFIDNFKELRLKRLLATHYSPPTFLEDSNAHKLDCLQDGNIVNSKLKGSGHFNSDECVELLKQSDVIVSNPPFSLWRKYIKLLTIHNKKFIVIGNMNAITYKEVFPLIKKDKMWLGVNKRVRDFYVPEKYDDSMIDESGSRIIKLGNIHWFTNLQHGYKPNFLKLTYDYDSKIHPEYENYNAINVDKTSHIPKKYDGVIGVPISFLEKHNPDQFEIIGSSVEVSRGTLNEMKKKGWTGDFDNGIINGNLLYKRLFIRHKRK